MVALPVTSHIINLSAGGRLHPTGDLHTPANQFSQIFANLAESEQTSLTIYFHGGVTNERNALRLAEYYYQEIDENFESYPLFFIWETGVLQTIQSELMDIVTGSPLFLKILQKLLVHASRKLVDTNIITERAETDELGEDDIILNDLARGLLPFDGLSSLSLLEPPHGAEIGELTESELLALRQDLADDVEASQLLQTIIDNAQVISREETWEISGPPDRDVGYLSAEIIDELLKSNETTAEPGVEPGIGREEMGLPISPGEWMFVARVLQIVLQRFRDGTDHGLMGTVLEEMYRGIYADKIGTFLWDEMKENARDAYAPNPEGEPNDNFHGGMLFLNLLERYMAEHGPIEINLIGYSAGSIHICHFLQQAARILHDGFTFKNVIFLAPACNFGTFQDGVVAHSDRIDAFRIFTMSDRYEKLDPLVKWAPLLYPHSLLYLVSGILEGDRPDTPLVGLARHLRGEQYQDDPVVQAGREYLRGQLNPVIYAVTVEGASPGEQSHFTSHYGQTKDPNHDRPTLDSMAALIRPEPEENLQSISMELTPELQRMLSPLPAVILEKQEDPANSGPMSTTELLGFELQGVDRESIPLGIIPNTASGPLETEPVLETLIGANDIVDHAILHGLLLAGRAVARVVTSGVEGLADLAPEERMARWNQATQNQELMRFYGTGWILGKARRVLITNNHVLPLPQIAETAKSEFGFERDIRKGARPQRVLRLDPAKLFVTSANARYGGLDYSVVALRQQAPEEYGYLEPVQGVTSANASNIFIVQHPDGDPKAYVVNHNHKVNISDRFLTYVSDTLSGSSGSPLFNDSLRLVGIHHIGDHTATIGGREETTNLGSRIEVVIEDIALQLLQLTEWDEEQVRYWFGDGIVLRTWRRLSTT